MNKEKYTTLSSVLKDAIKMCNKSVPFDEIRTYIEKNLASISQMTNVVSNSYPQGTYLVVDASCIGANPGIVEYRGIIMPDNYELFNFGPVLATNNIGEFLALVHGLAEVERQGLDIPIYSDSATALAWVRKKMCNTDWNKYPRLRDARTLVIRAEKWLNTHSYTMPYKWQTKDWGEIPADYGRK